MLPYALQTVLSYIVSHGKQLVSDTAVHGAVPFLMLSIIITRL
jgi:hypothetical protein